MWKDTWNCAQKGTQRKDSHRLGESFSTKRLAFSVHSSPCPKPFQDLSTITPESLSQPGIPPEAHPQENPLQVGPPFSACHTEAPQNPRGVLALPYGVSCVGIWGRLGHADFGEGLLLPRGEEWEREDLVGPNVLGPQLGFVCVDAHPTGPLQPYGLCPPACHGMGKHEGE